jgi:hypothetical protein
VTRAVRRARRALELLGTRVAPLVRKALAGSAVLAKAA